MTKASASWHCPYQISIISLFMLLLFAFIAGSPYEVFDGFVRILLSRSLLVTDYIAVGGLGAACLNAALSGFMAVFAAKANKVAPSGAVIMAIWLTTGFSFFGKNVMNILPIVLGVWLHSRLQKESFSKFFLVALLSTTLAPVVSEFAFLGMLHPALEIVIGLFVGIVVGLIMPVLAAAVPRMHSGYNLYNVGFAGGLLAVFLVGISKSFGVVIERPTAFSGGNNLPIAIFLYLFMGLWVFMGAILPSENKWGNFIKIMGHTGRSPTDYYTLYGNIAFINMGVLGILAVTIVLILGAQLTAAALAGIFTIMAFGAYGKHPLNVAPVMLGAIVAAAFKGPSIADPGNICTILFSSGLAPVAGQFGWQWGIVAGALHMLVTGHIGQLTEGLNLYNNGFAAGFVALFLVPLILAVSKNKKRKK